MVGKVGAHRATDDLGDGPPSADTLLVVLVEKSGSDATGRQREANPRKLALAGRSELDAAYGECVETFETRFDTTLEVLDQSAHYSWCRTLNTRLGGHEIDGPRTSRDENG